MNLVAGFLADTERRGGKTAIIDRRGISITFADFAARSAALAGAWRAAGLKSGDRVLLAMDLGIDLYVALAALWRIGAVVVFPEPALGLAGLRHAARIAQPVAFLASGWYRVLGLVLTDLRHVPIKLTPGDRGIGSATVEAVTADHPALMSFTSGSMGTPKAIVRSHGFLAAQNACVADLLAPGGQGAIDLVAFPVFVIVNLNLGITSVLPNWNLKHQDTVDAAKIAGHMRRHGVTRALLPPSICERLSHLAELPPLKAIFTGGGPVFPNLLERLRALLPGADIVAVYGSTEAEPIAHLRIDDISADDWQAMKTGAGLLAGHPITQIRLRLHDSEIIVAGDHVNKSYVDVSQNASNKLMIDGEIWHRTGDAGRLDDLGRLWLLGRQDARVGDLYPFSVEVAALSWPGVRRAALASGSGQALLAVEGDRSELDRWQALADGLGDIRVVPVDKIPLDRRHRSKVDYPLLRKLLAG